MAITPSRTAKALRTIGTLSCWLSTIGMITAPFSSLAQNIRRATPPHHIVIAHSKVILSQVKPRDETAWHSIKYNTSRVSAKPHPVQHIHPASLSLLDEVGRPAVAISPSGFAMLEAAAHAKYPSALALLHYGEALFGLQRHPQAALPYFKRAFARAAQRSAIRGLAAWDGAMARYRFSAYAASAAAFSNLQHSGFAGFSHRSASLMERHVAACAGYHDEHSAIGIPEPPKLDPFCGASALAVWLRAKHKDYQKAYLTKVCRVTGEGSTLADVLQAAKRVRVNALAVTADDSGLRELPKPLLAYVEHDHFIAVTKANSSGVTYVCSDCGPWPGGSVHLTWKQWRMLNPGLYAVFTNPGSNSDRAIASVGRSSVQLASAVLAAGIVPHVNAFGIHVKLYLAYAQNLGCGGKLEGQKCLPFVHCPMNCESINSSDPKYGDPVNLATGEEEYGPLTDLTVYNPIGPSVTWSRIYDSLRAPRFNGTYEYTDYGVGWSQSYNTSVLVQNVPIPPPGGGGPANSTSPNTQGGGSTNIYIIYPNGSRIQITPSSTTPPSATNLKVPCTATAGAGLLAEWDYNTTTGKDYFLITMHDRSKWLLSPVDPTYYTQPTGIGWYSLTAISDSVGNSIDLQYSNAYGSMPVMTEIDDSKGLSLLTVQRDAVGDITSVSDRYNRSIYYHVGTYNTVNVSGLPSYQELDHVSQIVPTGTANPPDRFVYGYSDVLNGEGSEQVPFLTSISVPSPTGTGMSTASLSYIPYTDYVNTITDANGNVTTFTQVDANHTKVSIANAQGVVAYSYIAGFDNNMSATTTTDGTNQTIVSNAVYSDPNDPYAPSEAEDANGVATGGAKGVWNYTHDQYGNTLTTTSPYGTVTTITYSYANFALGEVTQIQEGGKTPSSFTYYEPSGLLKSKSTPLPGTAGSGQTVTSSCTYDALGNLVSTTSPGNNAAATITTTFGYTNDGNYSQPEALNEPITSMDNLGNITHYRYDTLSDETSITDSLGNTTVKIFNIDNQPLEEIQPPTNEQGTGSVTTKYTYLYTGGPVINSQLIGENGNIEQQSSYQYGPDGETLGVSGSLQPATITYDALYRQLSITDGNGNTTHFTYNTAGYRSSITYPAGDTTQFTSYDPDGNCLQSVDGRGYITNYTYDDPTSKVTTISYTGPVQQTANYTYDSYGRIASVTDWNGAYSYSYDDNNATILDTTHYNGIPSQQISYDYYPNGSKSAITSSEGAAGYLYDADGRLVQLTNPYNEQFNWTYLNNSWEWTQSLPCGVKTVYTYDARGDIIDQSSLSGNTKLTDYSGMYYDAHGNRQAENVNIAGSAALSGVTNYQYDNRNELQTESTTRFGGLSNRFVYDAAGNATTFKGRAISYNIDNQIIGNTYDGNGNPAIYSGVSIAYDQVNRPTSFGSVLTAGYREDNLRAWKQNSSGKTYFIYDDERHPVLELNAAGTVTAYNTYCVEGLLSRRSSGVSHFYTFDPLGSLLLVFNSSGTILTNCAYDSTGVNEGGTTTDPFGFDARWGLYYDSETGLYLATYRYYDPVNGRFINRDPIHFAGGLNQYAYTFNNYTSADDSTGLSLYLCTRDVVNYLPCEGHSFQHWFLKLKCGTTMDCIGFGRPGITIEPMPCTINWGSGVNGSCHLMPCSPAQERCICSNAKSLQGCLRLCGSFWPGSSYDWLHHDCQNLVVCLMKTCGLPLPPGYIQVCPELDGWRHFIGRLFRDMGPIAL